MSQPPSNSTYPSDPGIVTLLRHKLPNVQAIYRYGSAGSAYERPDSDIDLAVLADTVLDHAALQRAGAELVRLTGRDIDLNDMRRLPVTLRVQIVANGTRLFAIDRAAAEEYDSRVLSDYAHLNEARKGILADVRTRGSIYG
jgi:predicted nucleotidyltransferase